MVSLDKHRYDLVEVIDASLSRAFGTLRRTVQKNLAVFTVAFLGLIGAARSGHGKLSLGSLFRILPTEGTPHAREKRLHRFLNNSRLDPKGVTDGLSSLIFGQRGSGFCPIIFDQTKSGTTQALFAGVPFEGRTLPLAVYTFDYPWQERTVDSQNQLEHIFLLDIEDALPQGVRAVFIGDRGYARAALLRQSAYEGRLYVIRGRTGTRIECQGQSLKLGELPYETGKAIRYPDIYYQAHERVQVDIIVFHAQGFKEPWYLLVPQGSEAILPTDTVVTLYRERMQVEQSFRDFKTHLGLRGLKLKVRRAERTGRLLLAFCIAYCLALILGISPEGKQARSYLEIPRHKPRHGTCRTLSALSIGMQMLSHPLWIEKAYYRLLCIAENIAAGLPILMISSISP
ncbi:MAG: transposase [bacterium]|nr:transposase [bacterium]